MFWFAFAVCFLSICGYLYVVRNNDYWKRNGVPHEEPSFLFGNVKDVMMSREHIARLCAKYYRKHKKSPYCGYYKMMKPAVVINDLELVRTVLLKDFFSFGNNDFEVDPVINPIIGLNPFILRDELWKKIRGSWTAGFSASRIKLLFSDINQCADSTVEYIKISNKEAPNEPFDAKYLLLRFFCDAICTSVFGLKNNSFTNPNNPCMQAMLNVFGYSFSHSVVLLLTFIFPWFGKLFKIGLLSKTSEIEILKLARLVIADRKAKGFQKTNPLDAVMTYNGKNDVTEVEVAGLCLSLLFDGSETTSVAGSFMLYSLAANPDIQRRLYEEIIEATTHAENGELTFDIIHNMEYLDMIFSESLRMYPPIISSQKVCTKEYQLPPIEPHGKAVTIHKGTNVVIPILGLHMDPDLFPEPKKFDPERFNSVNRSKIAKYSYIPFGDGPRMCLGARFATNELKIILVSLVKNFELRLDPRMVGKDIEIDPEFFLYRNVGGIWITFHERK